MQQHWVKRGFIYNVSGFGFFKSHVTRPIPYLIDDSKLRIFFASRDNTNTMLPTFIDVEPGDPRTIIAMPEVPLVDLGEKGTFDDSGVVFGSYVDYGEDVMFYYGGWKRRREVSFEVSIGMIKWNKAADTFERVFKGPIVAQDIYHPFMAANPFVIKEGDRYRMWYCSGTGWKFPEGNPEPLYTVFHAESHDGVRWQVSTEPCIRYAYDGEVISAPWVSKTPDGYTMWYSTRGCKDRVSKNYVIGMARSADGYKWIRCDEEVTLIRSDSGWDSEMVCYPGFYKYKGRDFMIYSGNHVGVGGIGYAILNND
ncbi:hypothetical protein Q8W71_25615 [Methylobacterium sp. NEAU 140]|uniref:hypothetical protein n=1 Tax=Methylobacterium sp. NEAU 140 TaxID=3064945 RepID=UPI002734AFD4|nr:hypothetical protein [Methylobacterium sp. NEAU 140]MDP4026012.1 hypothetical protein [Methylobacterium sp. NEAU 140]